MIVQRQPPTRSCGFIYSLYRERGWLNTWKAATRTQGCDTRVHTHVQWCKNSSLNVRGNLHSSDANPFARFESLRRNVRINMLTIGLPADRIVDPKVDSVRGLPLSMYEMYICTYDRTYVCMNRATRKPNVYAFHGKIGWDAKRDWKSERERERGETIARASENSPLTSRWRNGGSVVGVIADGGGCLLLVLGK